MFFLKNEKVDWCYQLGFARLMNNMNNQKSKKLISLCMIVRDSEKTLHSCLASIAPWVDEIVVVDTGSNDSTLSIAKQFTETIHHFKWCDDFAAARNESLRHATGDWIFWMDSDDEIDEQNGKQLRNLVNRKVPESIYGFVVQVRCPGKDYQATGEYTAVDHIKLIRNGVGIEFEGRIHEQVLMPIRKLGGDIEQSNVFVVHAGSDQTTEGLAVKYERDLRILNLDVAERPEHPFVHFNLGMTYCDMGDWTKAIVSLEKCLELSTDQESHVPKAYSLLVHCFIQAGKIKKAEHCHSIAIGMFPDDPELLFRGGVLQMGLGSHENAIALFESVTNKSETGFRNIDQTLVGYKSRHNLAICYERLGMHQLGRGILATSFHAGCARTSPGSRFV